LHRSWFSLPYPANYWYRRKPTRHTPCRLLWWPVTASFPVIATWVEIFTGWRGLRCTSSFRPVGGQPWTANFASPLRGYPPSWTCGAERAAKKTKEGIGDTAVKRLCENNLTAASDAGPRFHKARTPAFFCPRAASSGMWKWSPKSVTTERDSPANAS
jgi:hypothetical protein